jgi:hypothetical protein
MTTFSNPGIPSINPDKANAFTDSGVQLQYCRKCSLYSIKSTNKKTKTIHCSLCDICVEGINEKNYYRV